MTDKPPREGARWGDDPAPAPVTKLVPKKQETARDALIKTYGEKNVDEIYNVYERLRFEYPNSPTFQRDADAFAQLAFIVIQNTQTRYEQVGEVLSLSTAVASFGNLLDEVIKHNGTSYTMHENAYFRLGSNSNFDKILKQDKGAMTKNQEYVWDRMELGEEFGAVFPSGEDLLFKTAFCILFGIAIEYARYFTSAFFIDLIDAPVTVMRAITVIIFMIVIEATAKSFNFSRITKWISLGSFLFFFIFHDILH